LFGALIVGVVVLFMVVYSLREGFSEQGMDAHTKFEKIYARKYNDLGMNLAVSGTTGVLGDDSNSKNLFGSLTTTYDENGEIIQELDEPYPLEENRVGLFGTIDKCEAVNTMDCNAFDDPGFTKNCGVCLDIGKDSKQKPHTGGMVLLANDKKDAPRIGTQMPQYEATVGSCPAGKLVATKRECVRLQNQMACEKGNSFNTPAGCSQCYDTGNYGVVNPNDTESPELFQGSGTLYVCGVGQFTFSEDGHTGNTVRLSNLSTTPSVIRLLGTEGTQFTLTVTAIKVPVDYDEAYIYRVDDLIIFQDNVYKMVEGAGSPGYNPSRVGDRLWTKIGSYNDYEPKIAPDPKIYGSLIGGTAGNNTFQIDLFRIVNADLITGRKPRAISTQDNLTFNTQEFGPVPMNPLILMGSGFDKKIMTLRCTEPFTFVDMQSQEATRCPSSPFVTKEASANFLQSDPCYARGSGPGKYNLECLQGIFLTNGCVGQGRGYPTSPDNALNSGDTGSMTLFQLADFVYDKAITAATGVNANGQKQNIRDWSKASVFCTGKAITSPCDVVSGTISEDCIVYLWDNMGENKTQGSTYTLSSLATGLFSKGNNRRFCNRNGTLSPKNVSGVDNLANMAYWKKLKTVSAVRAAMAKIHLDANDSTTSEAEKKMQIMQCYGITLGTKPGPRITADVKHTGMLPGNSF